MVPVLLPAIAVIARGGGFADASVAGITDAHVAVASMTGIRKRRRTRNHPPEPIDDKKHGRLVVNDPCRLIALYQQATRADSG
jgi:hypothetical protein